MLLLFLVNVVAVAFVVDAAVVDLVVSLDSQHPLINWLKNKGNCTYVHDSVDDLVSMMTVMAMKMFTIRMPMTVTLIVPMTAKIAMRIALEMAAVVIAVVIAVVVGVVVAAVVVAAVVVVAHDTSQAHYKQCWSCSCCCH